MVGDRIAAGGIEYEVVWCGASDAAGVVPSLLSNDSRPSALAGLCPSYRIDRQKKRPLYVPGKRAPKVPA